MRKIFFTSLFIILWAAIISAQVDKTDSSGYIFLNSSKNILFSKFDKQLNTYNLNSGFNYRNNFGKVHLSLTENFISTFIKANPKNIKDEQYDTIRTEYSFIPAFSLGLLINNNILSDNRKIGLNQASVTNSYLYTKFFPFQRVTTLSFFGYSNNRQIGEKDAGFIYGGELLSDKIILSNMEFDAIGKFSNEDISPRKNTLRLFHFNLSNDVSDAFQNILSASFQQSRKDFYFSADTLTSTEFNITNNIQSRIETNYYVQDRLLVKDVSNPFILDILGRILWRKIDRNTRYRSLSNVSTNIFDVDVREFRLEFESSGSYTAKDFYGLAKFSFSERDEKHITKPFAESNIFFYEERRQAFEQRSGIESQKNNIAQRISMLFTGNYNLTKQDLMNFSFSHNKLTYDTPSDENFDDRDELLSIFRVSYLRNLSSFFDAFLHLEGSFNHIVYLFSERSSNNNIRRILKLGTGGKYHGKNFTSNNLFEVSANYTTYDFEDLNPNFRSFSFRQLSMLDSSSLRIIKNVFFDFYGYIRISEQGDFKWSSFSGKPTRDLDEVYLEPKIVLKRKPVHLAIGFRYLTLTTFLYRPAKTRETEYKSMGPLTEIVLSMNGSLYLKLNGWYEFITLEADKSKELTNLNLQVVWEL